MNHSEKRILTNELTGLKAMLCDPAGEVVITGSLADRQKIAAHLGALTDLSNDPAEDEGEEAASAPQVAPPLLDDAIGKTIEVLEDMPTHHPHYSIWTDHLTQLLEIERDQLRRPLRGGSYNLFGWDIAADGGDLSAFAFRTPEGTVRVYTGERPADTRDAGPAEPTIHASDITGKPAPAKDDVVDAEFPPTFIDFKSYPSGSPLRYSCYELVSRVVRNACPGGYNRSVVTYPRWHYVQQATGLGSTFSQQLCEHFGFDPDEQL